MNKIDVIKIIKNNYIGEITNIFSNYGSLSETADLVYKRNLEVERLCNDEY